MLEQKKGDKVVIFKKKRRKNYRRTKGHRQQLTVIRITDVLAKGQKGTATAKEAPAPAAAADGGCRTGNGRQEGISQENCGESEGQGRGKTAAKKAAKGK